MSVKLLKSKNDVAKAKPEVNCLNPRITGVARACRRGRLLYSTPFEPHATRNISPTLPYVDNQKQYPHQGSPTRLCEAYEASLRYHRFFIVNGNKRRRISSWQLRNESHSLELEASKGDERIEKPITSYRSSCISST